MYERGPRRFAGRELTHDELLEIVDLVAGKRGTSRYGLALSVCELLDWRRPHGGLKSRECRDLLEQLEAEGWLALPPKRWGRPAGSRTSVPVSVAGEPGSPLEGTVRDFGPVRVELVDDRIGRRVFRELIGRHHPLGYRVPFGAQLRYLLSVGGPERRLVGAAQFSSPAWRLAARDQWIGWDDETRGRNLQWIVQNSRLLVLPWVRVRNLASRILAEAARAVRRDWPRRYGVRPLLLETLVDGERFRGTCYRAANWLEVGQSAGRGRMDRHHERHGLSPRRVLLYPLVPDAARRLREG